MGIEDKMNEALRRRQTIKEIVGGEAANQGEDGIRMVLSVARNRAKRRGTDVYTELTRPKQFSAYGNKKLKNHYKPVEKTIDKWIDSDEDTVNGARNYMTKKAYNKFSKNPKHWASKMYISKTVGDHVVLKRKKK